ncbi:uncharacterized protein AFUA_8G02335 [Aspergillus fumigatus Af293]|uniref:Uncharacterized protein n=2 Tax=Aspergillus fumigatus TaxID=746128 RepID=A4DA43_ASPFU|nr:conserved hypothetical protein [Aspergillus fumigatus Af293]EBA27211.1 conserved hypothetical protein [Aspergillus fumigatus Af293]EDP48975.1 conserved hypothetical protein [Aspergillus fumigatus A1163]
MGRVTATSGKATLGERISDWAFVEMNDVAIEKSFRPNHMFPVRGYQQPSRCKAGGEPLTNFDPLIEDGAHDGNYYRPSPWDAGDALLQDCTSYGHVGNKNDLSAATIEEYIIVSRGLNTTEHTQASFVVVGDSRSHVIDKDQRTSQARAPSTR